VANLHLGRRLSGVRADLKARPRRWLERAAADMADAVEADWRQWVRHVKRQRSSRL
jgi:NADH:ubiquinone oxidoreductase subunit